MTFSSVYEMTNPLTTVRKQHFWEYFSGSKLQEIANTSGFAGTWGKSPSNSQFEVSGGKLNFLDSSTSTGDRTWIDLGTDVSETAWVLRFKFRFTTLAVGTYYYEFGAGLSDTTVDNDTNQDFIGVRCLPAGNANLWRPRVCNGTQPRRGSSQEITQSFSTGTDYYCEIKRTSATNWSISLSTTNAYDGDIQNNSFADASSGITGLRYFKFGDAVTNTTSGANMQGYCDVLEFYNGVTAPSGRWGITDRNSSNHTGSGMSDSGYILQGNSSGGSAQQTILSFMDIKPFSKIGSVCIAVAKLGATGTNEQGGWGMCGDMPNYWLNGIKINVPQSGNIGFYTMNNTTEYLSDTGVAISTASSYHVYKLEQLNGSSKCSIDGVLKNDVTTSSSTTPMQPFVYSKFDNSAVHIKYMECYNT